ncbi:conserved hypothetical protein [Ricinus communis]|uniref:Uncharacterized protein n=1 Tax=Ricinus communis TaxID=3988 RepID=B9TE33_RICCO|nr:conserved hypothetical protein [Ricinus communis]
MSRWRYGKRILSRCHHTDGGFQPLLSFLALGAQEVAQLQHGRRDLRAVHADHVERRRLSHHVRQQHLQAPGADVGADVQPRLVGDADAGHRPAPHHVRVVGAAVAADVHHVRRRVLVAVKTPAVVDDVVQHEAQTVVLREVVQRVQLAVLFDVVRRGHQHAAVVRRQRQRDQAGVLLPAVTDGDVDRLPVHVRHAVADAQLEHHLRIARLELVQPAHHQVAAQVGGHGDFQRAAQRFLALNQSVVPLLQQAQRFARVAQIVFALLRQPQRTRGARKQAQIQLALQALDGGAGQRRRDFQLAGGGRQAAAVGGADKHVQIIKAQQFSSFL